VGGSGQVYKLTIRGMMDQKTRLRFVDGLRGLAILMVLFCHSVWQDLDGDRVIGHLSMPRTVVDSLSSWGFEGVSLFLVVSGFCLSYPAWQRRAEGYPDWFDPRRFFARRCLRILPPYYAVLLALTVSTLVLSRRTALPPSMTVQPLTLPNLLSHVLLLHNVTRWYAGINGSFWSLGLEWQWYWVFPVVLALAARSLWLASAACVAAAIGWHVATGDLLLLWHHSPATVSARLCEFMGGVVAAHAVVAGQCTSRRARTFLVACLLLPIVVSLPGPASVVARDTFGQPQPFWGISFTALILLGSTAGPLNRVLSSYPAVRLGIISYSLYLVHQPVLEAVEMAARGPLAIWWIVRPVAISAAIVAGWVVYACVERPCLSSSARDRLEGPLRSCFAWTQAVWHLAAPEQKKQAEVL
jgi:peptidoglycan/LPS O-acetylase OafA/YrhL